ncbi:ferrous iron transport protein B [Pseudogemmatithrix spongiicola]|uniref:Ferrous iron transport protein B n=1 Tax=Pseudogemmatithrix spongiicola TaxID=3062599 RepID=A0AA49Q7L3_9BACT|nr:ferrous iron transport protein B [Gemmatimonadaceae bacterium 'strain 138']WKW15838.1 ferrous iron transport protein B [Gemmatimonadaceae bacterium 'strain 318']
MAASAPAAPRESTDTLRVALIGNPNTGKTTLFNALTGLRQRVGNFAGVTVERVEGVSPLPDGRRATVLDLPGSYSLSAGSPDEQIALEVLLGRDDAHYRPHVVCVVADASHLERNLYLASQVLELGLPVVIALNQFDVAEAQGIRIDVPALIHELGVPVIPTVAHRGEGLEPLRRALVTAAALPAPMRRFTVPADVEGVLAPLQGLLERGGINYAAAGMEALRLLGVRRDEPHLVHVDGLAARLEATRAAVAAAGYVPERLESELRYTWIGGVLSRCVERVTRSGDSLSDRIDAVLLHRLGGPLIFLAIMALVFQSVFTWAAPVQDLFESAAVAMGSWVGGFLPEGDLRSLVVDGVFAGVGSVIVFVPQIAILFAFIGLLEQTGYMARAAYLMDRVMRRVGLHGKSFIPMLSGYACAVPGIMATRTIDDPKDRLATIMVVPLMSCSARLPVYTLLIGTFVPALPLLPGLNLQGFTMLVMYLLGTVAALAIAFLFRRTLLKGPVRPMLLELPSYRMPSLGSLAVTVWQRCQVFLQRAGTVILSLSIVLWALATYPKAQVDTTQPETVQQEQQLAHSVLGRFGHAVEPVVAPLGYDWKIGVSIVASFAAREVFVSTMGTIYGVGGEDEAALSDRLLAERRPDGTARYTPLIAVGLMVFYVFALMCISTVAVTVRESGGGAIGWRWASIQFGYMLVLAYAMAYLVIIVGRALGYAG